MFKKDILGAEIEKFQLIVILMDFTIIVSTLRNSELKPEHLLKIQILSFTLWKMKTELDDTVSFFLIGNRKCTVFG